MIPRVARRLAYDSLSLQRARPWHMDGKSNLAKDNAVNLSALFSGRRVALFGVPAPFTGTCTLAHVPPYAAAADEFLAVVDELVCFSVADPYAHHNWAKAMGVDSSKLSFLADDGSVTEAWELSNDYSAASLGVRSKRFSMLVEDGVVKAFQIVEEAEKDAGVLLAQAKKR